MNFIKKPIIFIALALLAIPVSGFAQYQFEVQPFFSYFKQLDRYELGFNYGLLSSGQYQGMLPYVTGGDTILTRNIASTGLGGTIGLSVPIKATGHISCWAMDIHLMVNMYTTETLNQTMSTDGSLAVGTPALTANTLQIALPVGIEWKVGTDAICTKRLAMGGSFGAGVMPQYNSTTMAYSNTGNAAIGTPPGSTSLGLNPYAKVEFAFNLGMVIKLRLLYTMGNIDLIDVNKPIPYYTDGPFRIISNSNLMATITLMPFSLGWRETAWWNTHDTYNQRDKLN